MNTPSTPGSSRQQRLEVLRETGLLDAPPDPTLDRFTQLATALLDAPMSLLTLLDEDRQFFMSSVGLPEPYASQRETPLSHSFCQHVVLTGTPLVVEDAAAHPLVRGNPARAAFGVGAYAGFPVRAAGAHVLGDLCAIDRHPRRWEADQLSLLETLTAMVEREIEQRLAVRRSNEVAARERAELEALLASLPPFRTLVEQSLVGIAVLDAEGFSYVNPRFTEIFGYSEEEVRELPAPWVLAVEEDRELVRENVRRRLEGSVADLRYTFRARRRDGREIEVEVQGTRTQLGKRPVIISTVLDVTEQRAAARGLQAAEERYRLVLRATSSAVWDWDALTGRVLWNGHGHELLRYRSDEMGDTITWWYEQLHPEERRSAVSALRTALEGSGETWSHEHRFRRGDGSYATVLDCGSILRDGSGKAVRVIGSMTDVTERKRQEQAQEFLARASALLSESPGHELGFVRLARLSVPSLGDACVIDLCGGGGRLERVAVAHVDPSVEKRLAVDGDVLGEWIAARSREVLRTRRPEVLPDTGQGVEDPALRGELVAGGLASAMAVPLEGRERTLGVILLGNSQTGGRYGPFDLVFAEDVARRAALALEGELLFEEANEAIAARDEVLRVVTHDLLNPLNVVQLTAEFLMTEAQDRRSENHQKLELIGRAAGQMQRLVQDLLEVSRLEDGNYGLDSHEQAVEPLLAEAEALLGPVAAQKSIELQVEVADSLGPVRMDGHRMLRVVANLIGNAIKFTPEGGQVTVRAARTGDEVRFTVSDTGPGIAPDLLSHVFDRYWQARKGDRRGAGLGLAIAKGIVEAHGGRIWALSPPNRGAEFVFTVPAEA